MEFPYEKHAMYGDPMPPGLKFPDKFMYICLSHLYAQYRSGVLPRQEASTRKTSLISDYAKICEDLDFLNKSYAQSARMWKDIESATTDIRKDGEMMKNPKVRALMIALYGDTAEATP